MCQKSWASHTSHFEERAIFSRSDGEKSSVPQKERFLSELLQNLDGKSESEPHGEIAQTLEKLAKNDPTEPHTVTQDKSTADSSLWSNTFCFFGGGVLAFVFLIFCLAPCYFFCLSSSCWWCCLFFFVFSLSPLFLLLSSKDKEELKNEWKRNEKGKKKQKKDRLKEER